MTIPAFGRLVRLYSQAIHRLFPGRTLLDVIDQPWLMDTPEFIAASERIALAMAKEVTHANASSWRAAAFKAQGGKRIYAALKEDLATSQLALRMIAARNARLIRSLPRDIAQQVTKQALELQSKGARPAELAKFIREQAPKTAKWKIQLIARTEIARSESDVTRVRSQRIGIDWFEWSTSRDARVRKSHRNMENVLVSWSDLPSPEALVGERNVSHYGPGGVWNCRCAALPLADLNEVRWPVKVYRSGSLQRMSRAQFLNIAGEYRKAA